MDIEQLKIRRGVVHQVKALIEGLNLGVGSYLFDFLETPKEVGDERVWLDEFESDVVGIDVSSKSDTLTVTLDFAESVWYLSAETGYYRIGVKYPLEDDRMPEVMKHVVSVVMGCSVDDLL